MPVSTLDIVGNGRFALLTGIGGEAWLAAADRAAAAHDVPIDVHVIGPRPDFEDLLGTWAEAREVGEAGCILVRPDQHVAFRAHEAAASVEAAERLLDDALMRILGRAAE